MEDRIGITPAPWREAAKKIEAHLGDPRLSEDYLRFRMELARAYAEAQAALEQKFPAAGGPASAGLLAASDVVFAPEILQRLFSAVIQSRKGRAPGEEMVRIIEQTGQEPGRLPRIAELSVFAPDGDELQALAAGMGVQVIALLFLGRLLAAPFVAAAVQRRPSAPPGASETGVCPACGSPPLLAKLRRGDGKRLLICSICPTEWSYPRIRCAFCRNTAADTLPLLSLPDADGRWIEACDQCLHYLKTIDERKMNPGDLVDPFVEETITLPLDLLAEREGYLRYTFSLVDRSAKTNLA